MSEYQYYEFAAVDRPLDGRQLDELRALSTRADITATSFVNSYQWGGFRGDPRTMMERYFDGFLYLANWGTHELMLRLPARLLDIETARRYCPGGMVSCWANRGNVVLHAESEDENGDYDEGGERMLASILPVRADVMSGDHRSLYILWLVAVQAEELDSDELEPPVPAGLGALTGSQTALADFLRLDGDLLDAAADGSTTVSRSGPDVEAWVAGLPARERDALLVELLLGDDPHLRPVSLRRAGASVPGERRRTVEELWSLATARRDTRLTAERVRREAAAAERGRAAAALRERRLSALRAEGEAAWRRVAALVATKKPAEYDRTVDLLVDLRDVCPAKEFRRRIGALRDEHRRKPSLIDRLDHAGL